jgi:type I restriction enzyme S subunit
MREGWRETTVESLIDFVRNGLNHPQTDDPSGLPVTRIETISNDQINPDRVRFICDLDEEKARKFTLQEGDVLFSHINSLPQIGRAVMYRGYPETLLHGMNLLALRPNREVVVPEFLEHLLQALRAQGYFRDIASRAVNQVSINQKTLKAVPVNLPPLAEQRRIADLMTHTDEVIARGRQTVEALDRMRARLLADLLSDERAKAGAWRGAPLTAVSEIVMGQSPPGSSYNDRGEGLPFMQGSAEFGIKSPTPIKWCTEPRRIAEEGDCLVSVRAPVGALNVADQRIAIGRGLAIIKPKEGLDRCFLPHLIEGLVKELRAVSGGGVFDSVTKAALSNVGCWIPPASEQRRIAFTIDGVDTTIEAQRTQREELERLRSGLLSALLSGEHEIPESYDRFLAEVA